MDAAALLTAVVENEGVFGVRVIFTTLAYEPADSPERLVKASDARASLETLLVLSVSALIVSFVIKKWKRGA